MEKVISAAEIVGSFFEYIKNSIFGMPYQLLSTFLQIICYSLSLMNTLIFILLTLDLKAPAKLVNNKWAYFSTIFLFLMFSSWKINTSAFSYSVLFMYTSGFIVAFFICDGCYYFLNESVEKSKNANTLQIWFLILIITALGLLMKIYYYIKISNEIQNKYVLLIVLAEVAVLILLSILKQNSMFFALKAIVIICGIIVLKTEPQKLNYSLIIPLDFILVWVISYYGKSKQLQDIKATEKRKIYLKKKEITNKAYEASFFYCLYCMFSGISVPLQHMFFAICVFQTLRNKIK